MTSWFTIWRCKEVFSCRVCSSICSELSSLFFCSELLLTFLVLCHLTLATLRKYNFDEFINQRSDFHFFTTLSLNAIVTTNGTQVNAGECTHYPRTPRFLIILLLLCIITIIFRTIYNNIIMIINKLFSVFYYICLIMKIT